MALVLSPLREFNLSKLRLLFAIAIACLSFDATAQNAPVDKPAFTEFVAQLMRREVRDTPVVVKGPLTLAVGDMQANLDRIFVFCRANSSGCIAEIDLYIKGVAHVFEENHAPLDKAAVRLVVRSSKYIRQAQASMGSSGPALQVQPIVEGLMLVAVLDTPHTIRPLNDTDLRSLNMTKDQLFDLGRENLVATLKPFADSVKPVKAGQIGALTGSFYEVGRVAMHARWEPLARAQNDTLLIALPTTDAVLYISEATPAAIDALRTFSRNVAAQSPNPLAPEYILKWTSERWELVPPL